MKLLAFLTYVLALVLPNFGLAGDYIFNDDTLGHYTCRQRVHSMEYSEGILVDIENCKIGLETYYFFSYDMDGHDKCFELDTETSGYQYRNIVPITNCRTSDKEYTHQLVRDQINPNNKRCYELDLKTSGHKYRNRVDLKDCEGVDPIL